MTTGQVLYLAMCLAAFATFILTLAGVSAWVRLRPAQKRQPERAQLRPASRRTAAAQV